MKFIKWLSELDVVYADKTDKAVQAILEGIAFAKRHHR